MALTMPIFVSAQTLIDRMGLDAGTPGLVPEVEKAIVRAEIYLQSLLQSKLMKTSWVAYYHLDADAFSGIQVGGVFRLELPSGMLVEAPTVSVSSSTETNGGNIFGDYTSIADGYLVEPKPGYLLVSNEHADKYVKVECVTGYLDGETIPEEVSEAIYGYAPTILDAESTKDRATESNSKFNLANSFILTLLQPYQRAKGFSIRPLSFTEELVEPDPGP